MLVLILLAAAFFRFSGLMWGEFQYLHPDERFFVWVTADMSPVQSIAEYFNTALSTLNPHNVGHTFFVYGTFPVIAVRYLVQWIYGSATWEQVLMVGRTLSASLDLVTVLLVFLIGERLFNKRVGVLGAAFSAAAVMQIQQSHFYTADSFATTFSVLAVYFAICLVQSPLRTLNPSAEDRWWWLRERFFHFSLAFGAAVGLAMACKINTAPVAILLPAAVAVRALRAGKDQRQRWWNSALFFLVGGGLAALLVFRLLQPYAFSGPGFFGLAPNPLWISNLKDLAAQTQGDVDFPPALQWARRSITFSLQNMVQWGMGLPFGILAWIGFFWMGWRMIKGAWPRTALVWGWTALYFIWQSLQGNPTMRYQLPIYPLLALMAGWALNELWNKAALSETLRASRIWKIIAWTAGIGSLGVTLAWAYAFSQTYVQPMTRVAASDWIFANVPAAINLSLTTEEGAATQPLAYSPQLFLNPDEPIERVFTAETSGVLTQISLGTVQDIVSGSTGLKTVQVAIQAEADPNQAAYGQLTDLYDSADSTAKVVVLDQPMTVVAGQPYRLVVAILDQANVLTFSGRMKLTVSGMDGEQIQSLTPYVDTISAAQPQEIEFRATYTGAVDALSFFRIVDAKGWGEDQSLTASLYAVADRTTPLASATIGSTFSATDDARGQSYTLPFAQPIEIVKDQAYVLHLDLTSGGGALALYGSAPANETSWDDGLPIRRGNYDPYGGMYEGDLNFEMYWEDNAEKLQRFEDTLDAADYLFISSNRQWGTTTRVQERYPLTTQYYRSLMGCPAAQSVINCYRDAQMGTNTGELGFELVQVFESRPTLGPISINDQYAEEAFTVYDHPKVFIFKKTAAYDSAKVASILESVDLSTVTHVIPGLAESYPEDLMLPDDRLAQQQAGGTWSDYFSYANLQNKYPGVGLVLWYLTVTLLGWLCYPLVRAAMPGLPDKGFPLVKITGMLLLAWMVWFASSTGLTFTRPIINLAFGIILLTNGLLAWRQSSQLKEEWRLKKRYFLTVEAVGLAFFVFFLAIRLANPDLWHPSFGGEKPMDFAYFNAVLKSTTFPAYNPWLSGGYINYYYFGFVLVGVLTKWLGIVPSIAYNLILPTLASLLALGAFSAAWNLTQARETAREVDPDEAVQFSGQKKALWAGVGAALAVVVIGNLGTVRQIWHGLMKLAAPNGTFESGNIFLKLSWTFEGLIKLVNGGRLPYSTGDWYWIPSRALPGGGAITEFPFFTFLYADPHAHMFALALTVLALGWAISVVLGQWNWTTQGLRRGVSFLLSMFLGALVVFALRPTNTWDFPTYLGLGAAAIIYTGLRFARVPEKLFPRWPLLLRRLVLVAGCLGLLYGMGTFLFKPYTDWYALGYSQIYLWKDEKSDFASYFTHWGLFLVMILSWMTASTIDWMAKTPISALNKILRAKTWLFGGLAIYVGAVILLALNGVQIGWFVLTMMVWVLILLLRSDQPEAQRVMLFMVGLALALTLAVEIVVLVGDVGRMNTVFKFYLQAWVLMATSAAICFVWLLPQVILRWKSARRNVWIGVVSVLAAAAVLYTLMAGTAKIRDRMSVYTPAGLDGIAYMQTSTYSENDQTMDLNQDYLAIRWMQEHVQGSPVIAEAETGLYRWGSRFSIYTGLPTVLGWDWHEIQQRSVVGDNLVNTRAAEVDKFYNTTDALAAESFILKYNVKYIIVGQLERVTYTIPGISKFETNADDLWREVYRDQDTVIYEVTP